MELKPLVAIGVPVYNGGKYLRDCLDSIINQTYTNWECLISENQSKDNSLEIAEEYAKKDKRFKIYRCPEFVGHVENWNNTWLHSNMSAKYFKMVQADDMILPECLEKYLNLLEKHPEVGVASSFRLNSRHVDQGGLDIFEGNVFNGKRILYDQLTREIDISGTNTTLIFSVEHLKKLADDSGIFHGRYHVDTELFYEMSNISDVGFVYQVLTYTRRHESSGTSTEVYNWGTLHQLNEAVLYRYKGDDKLLNELYRRERLKYAYFFLNNKISRNKEVLAFHRKHIVRPFNIEEYISGIVGYNYITNLLVRIFNRIKRASGVRI